ncbi:cell division protein FtsQ/DivIB [Glutamicibacter sp. AOP38-B1-38]|uniref:cell division protein FtsQ/DivIB n=1 Tax=Glutamicibacter sp. AOP38-B1-38 TaxID=3457680 RepID=UPI00403349F0
MGENTKVVELPASPEKKRRKLLIIIAASIVALSIAAVLILSFSPLLAAKKIEVTGSKLVSEQKLLEALAPLEGVPLPRISESRVVELIGDQPAVDEIVVRAKMPDTLVVEVVEAVPVAILVEGKNSYIVSSTGEKLKKVGENDKTKLPRVKASDQTKDPEQFQLLTGILSTVEPNVLKQVSTATLTQAGFMELALPKKRTLIWGDGGKAALKNEVAKIFLDELNENPKMAKVIDVTNPENPVTY